MKTFTIKETAEVEEIIKSCRVCYVGMIDTDGSPYVVPMNFAYNDNTFYLHSGIEGKKMTLLTLDNRVCLSLHSGESLIHQHPDVACSYSMVSKSIVCKGQVAFVEDLAEKTTAMDLIMSHYSKRTFTYSPAAIANVRIWKIVADEISCKSFGNRPKRK